MSVEGLRRPVILSVSIATAIAAAYLLYQTYNKTEEAESQALHRSNAVRRPRRRRAQADLHRAREGDHGSQHAQGRMPQGLRPIVLADTRLEEARRLENVSFGTYQNHNLLLGRLIPEDISLELNPTTLETLYTNVASLAPDLASHQLRSLRQHVDAMFVREFVRGIWADGEQISVADRTSLQSSLQEFGLDRGLVRTVVDGFNTGRPLFSEEWDSETHYTDLRPDDLVQADGVLDDPMSLDEPNINLDDEDNEERGHNMLNLLYHIAQEQAKRNGYVHRGVECNGCGACPILGVRYHCANCFDYDLCETCEAKEVHIRTHVFYKVRIPAPSRGQIKQVTPKWYPGNPNAFPQNLPKPIMDRLKSDTGLDNPEIQGLYDQYKCIAGHEHPTDPSHLGMAIDRKAFDMYFIPIPSNRPAPANLIYDRIFAFYDANDDGFIDFMEFIKGITKLNDKSLAAKLRRLFDGYDLDGDGYVSRKDFLRMFRAYYDLSTQLNREMLHRNEDMDLDDEIRETIQGSHPISAAFGGNLLFGHLSRPGEDKDAGFDGDLDIVNPPYGVLQDDLDMTGDRARAVGDAATGNRSRHHPFRTFRSDPPQDEQLMHVPHQSNVELLGIQHADDASEDEISGPDPPFQTYGWPPLLTPEPQDISSALGADIPIEDITDPVDRSRVFFAQSQRLDAESDNLDAYKRQQAVHDRWRRRQFYVDEEEGMKRPVGYAEPDSSEDESDDPPPETIDSPRRQSMRSRSSSKVRFDDSAIDTDYETRSNASSRSIPQNERWGGYELSRPTTDVGGDVLYEAVQQGFNELLDCLFKPTENLGLEAQSTRNQRALWSVALDAYAKERRELDDERAEALVQADKIRTDELLKAASEDPELFQLSLTGEGSDSPRAREAASQIQAQINEAIQNVNAASALSRDVTPDPPRAPASTSEKETDYHDPTLPQFRPNAIEIEPPLPDTASEPPLSPPTRSTLARWLRHRRIDEESETRGGSGRLSFIEFRKLIEAQVKKERSDAKGKPVNGGVKETERIVGASAQGDDLDPEYWEKSADLGRLAFLCTWLEMASF
ncbi:uncharacterized protein HMPREF1541_06610 [Cyphellophora europaea CBS 101466]|uniref:Uncharacterized protein n=1 Tax=Cyphellophora europaea (strain CBS 101466) TaxID=1220924 RepID=W2RS60_CYPE1|nr:uncharacterized protein HMPREF1541_06610 [Cyphellophora europaea CBS 101466]ETN38573.1 hypothetical protein HMPREF1541_06610 [Cyphellophora europaea CBS 101466]